MAACALLATVASLAMALPVASAAAVPVAGSEQPYVALVPPRVFDTRIGLGGVRRPLGPGEAREALVVGVGGVPLLGVQAVVLNLTAVGATTQTFVTGWPTGQPRPAASALNPRPGGAYPNLVVAQLGIGGRISLFNQAGSVDLFADVVGFYREPSGYAGLVPSRILDTRIGIGGAKRPLGPGETRSAQVLGLGGVPAAGVAAVVLNLTAVGATIDTFVTEWPAGYPRPAASTLNPRPGGVFPNLVVAQVGQGGRINLFNQAGTVEVLADVVGYFVEPTVYTSLAPTRVLDTRIGIGGVQRPLGPGEVREAALLGFGGVPASGVTAVVLNLTAVGATAETFITEWPSGQPRPAVSSLNPRPGGAYPNLVVAQVGQGGRISLFNQAGSVDLLADVVGYYRSDLAAAPAAPAWVRQINTGTGDNFRRVAVDPAGDVVVAGGTGGTLVGSAEPNGGGSDAFVTKYGPYGEVRWVHQLGGAGYESASGLAVDAAGGITIAGHVEAGELPGAPEANQGQGDAYVARYDAAGIRQWVHVLGSSGLDSARAVAVDALGNAFVTGRTRGILPMSTGASGNESVFLAKYSASGELQWVRQMGADTLADVTDVAVGPDGAIVITGSSWLTMPGAPQEKVGGRDVFVVKLDAAGQQLWVHQMGSDQFDDAGGIAVDPSGDVVVVGTTTGTMSGAPETWAGSYDGFITRLDPAGNSRWIHQFGEAPWEVASDVAIGPSGELFVTGSKDGVRQYAYEIYPQTYNAFLASYSPSGDRRWSTGLGSGAIDMATGVAVDSLSRVFIVGTTGGTLPGSLDVNPNPPGPLQPLNGFVAIYRTWPHAS